MLVCAVEERDRAAAVETLVEAFVDDPTARHLAPENAGYPAFAEAFFGCLFDPGAHGGGEVRTAETDISGGPHLRGMWRSPALTSGEVPA